MKVTYNWLKQYVDFDWSPDELAERLTMIGLEVEGVKKVSGGFDGIVVAEVLSKEPHPDADRLSLCKVNDGTGERQIVCGATNFEVGSKVSLAAYDRLVAADSDDQLELALNEHVKAVKRHIEDLAGKDYTNLAGIRSPSFVLMFMPIEPAYIEALKYEKDLFAFGYERGVVLVSHTTLIPILTTVANLWSMERSTREARELGDKAGDIYNQVRKVAERLGRIGGSLSAATNHYNDTVKALSGRQGLRGKVERFAEMSSKVTRSIPELEPLHHDIQSESLEFLAEPLQSEKEPGETRNEPQAT